MTEPKNDLVLVELDDKKYAGFTASVPSEGQSSGKLVAVSDKIFYLSSFSYVLEESFSHPEALEELRQYWKSRIGKTVRWEERADKGLSFDENGKKYATIKITKLTGEVK